jgi:hypothetical protein
MSQPANGGMPFGPFNEAVCPPRGWHRTAEAPLLETDDDQEERP